MKTRLLAAFMLIAYSAVLVKVMIFKEVPMIRVGALMLNFGGSQTGPANLVPFKTILVYLLGDKGWVIGGLNIIGNIVLLLPVGLLVPLVFRNWSWKKMLAIAVGAGFAIEGMQVVLRVGIFDIDDVILNGLGVMAGYWLFTILAEKLRSMESKNIRMIALVIIVFAAVTTIWSIFLYQSGQLPVRFRTCRYKR